jgi:hypothetical protein
MRRKRSGLISGCKGNVSIEVIIICVVLLAFSLAAIYVYGIFTSVMDDVRADPEISDTAKAPTEQLEAQYPSIFDSAFLIILIVLWLAAIISAFQIDTYPIFFGISVFALVVILCVPPILANSFEETMDDETTDFSTSFPFMFYIMGHLLEISIFIGASVLVSLYAKSRQG